MFFPTANISLKPLLCPSASAKPQDFDFMPALVQGSLVQIAHAHHAADLRTRAATHPNAVSLKSPIVDVSLEYMVVIKVYKPCIYNGL
jgi:hypothetical protein